MNYFQLLNDHTDICLIRTDMSIEGFEFALADFKSKHPEDEFDENEFEEFVHEYYDQHFERIYVEQVNV